MFGFREGRWWLVGGRSSLAAYAVGGKQHAFRHHIETYSHYVPTQCAGAGDGVGAVAAGAAGFVPKSTLGVAREASDAWKYAGFCL